MEAQRRAARERVKAGAGKSGHEPAVLRFRHTAAGSGVSRHGHIRPGAPLVVGYDPARLPPTPDEPSAESDIVCHVRFRPGGEQHSGPVGDTGGGSVESGATRHAPFEVAVPQEATTVELWFERRGPAATLGWDSRYGQNYSFPVIGKGLPVPEPPAAQRPDARVDEKRIRVLEDTARKQEHVMGTAARRVHTGLSIHALVKEVSASTDVWADIHVFDGADELIHAGNVTLQPRESTPNGTLFVWEDDVYQGSGGGSGMGVWVRPDAHTIQYRLYCQVAAPGVEYRAQVFTDGILHEFEVPADEEVSGAQAELRGSSS